MKKMIRKICNGFAFVGAAFAVLIAYVSILYNSEFSKQIGLNFGKNISINTISTNSFYETEIAKVNVKLIKPSAPKINYYEIASQNIPQLEVFEEEESLLNVYAFLKNRFYEVMRAEETNSNLIIAKEDLNESNVIDERTITSAILKKNSEPRITSAKATQKFKKNTLQAKKINDSNKQAIQSNKGYSNIEAYKIKKTEVNQSHIDKVKESISHINKNPDNIHIDAENNSINSQVQDSDKTTITELLDESTKEYEDLQEQLNKNMQSIRVQEYADNEGETIQSGISKNKESTDSQEDRVSKLQVLINEYQKSNTQQLQKEYSFKDFVMVKENLLAQNSNNINRKSENSSIDDALSKIKEELNTDKTLTENNLSAIQKFSSKITPNNKTMFRVEVVDAFTGAVKKLSDVKAKIIGTDIEMLSNEKGIIEFTGINVQGVLPVLLMKEGYLQRRIDLKNHSQIVEMVSDNAAAFSTIMAGDVRREGFGFFFGQLVSPIGEAVENHKVEIYSDNSANVFYLNEKGFVDKTLNTTSKSGQFILINLKPGQYNITMTDLNGVEKAPHIINVGDNEGIVKKLSLGKSIDLNGKTFNAVFNGNIIESLNVQLLGNSKTVITDKKGDFKLLKTYLDCNENNYLQFEKSGFYRSRVEIMCSDKQQNFYLFPAAHVDALINETQTPIDARSGMIIGHSGRKEALKFQLWGPYETNMSAQNRGLDFYFDKDGIINTSRGRTSSNGNYLILNAPDGLSYLQTFNKSGETEMIWPIYTSPSTVNIIVQ